MKKLKNLTSVLSVLALMCFANVANGQASYLLTSDASAVYPAEIILVNASVRSNAQGSKTLTMTLPANTLTADLKTKVSNANTFAQVADESSQNEIKNQIVIEVAANVNLADLSKQYFDNGIAIGKEILLQLQ